ncbi:MAG: glycosyltransferase [Actinomycetia bacterium]|nr:glycosyltransferase [Actinomycetes bacterium]MCP4224352.1 glycosyltransferase [Actinomycetes bacterium]
MRVLFATAELRPLVSTGGLGEASAGLVGALRRLGHDVEVILPDYAGWELEDEDDLMVRVPGWASPACARRGVHREAGRLILVSVPGIERPHPYVDAAGIGWPDNDSRFAAFSAAVASVAELLGPDIVQLNDWHTGLVPALLGQSIPTVLTIHNLAHQGWANIGWLHELPTHRDSYHHGDALNMLAGAIRAVDAVVTVSPTYATEIVTEAGGMGLNGALEARDQIYGIRNGIDTMTWDPAIDPHLPASFSFDAPAGKEQAKAALVDRAGWGEVKTPVVAMVTRLAEQKGVDLAFEAARYLEGMRARLMVLGSGEQRLADWGRWLTEEYPGRFWFIDGYDVPLSHLMFAGADLFLMPSRFEPCGLAQMQAMAYGTIPVVTGVGGLGDTVMDADASRDGNGFVSQTVDLAGVVDALHRALSAWRHAGRRRRIIRHGMAVDWSWAEPAVELADLYESVMAAAAGKAFATGGAASP